MRKITYYGLTNPSKSSSSFNGCPVYLVYVTKDYSYINFCGFAVALIPTNYFTMSEVFTASSQFWKSLEFTETNEFSNCFEFTESNVFTKIDYIKSKTNEFSNSFEFTESNAFTKSDKFSSSNYFTSSEEFTNSKTLLVKTQEKTKQMSFSFSYSITYVSYKSVSYSISYLHSNTYMMSYTMIDNTYKFIQIWSYYLKYFPYIIQFYSPLSVETYISIPIVNKKKITPEQLIGVVCGSCSVFFLVLGMIILVM